MQEQRWLQASTTVTTYYPDSDCIGTTDAPPSHHAISQGAKVTHLFLPRQCIPCAIPALGLLPHRSDSPSWPRREKPPSSAGTTEQRHNNRLNVVNNKGLATASGSSPVWTRRGQRSDWLRVEFYVAGERRQLLGSDGVCPAALLSCCRWITSSCSGVPVLNNNNNNNKWFILLRQPLGWNYTNYKKVYKKIK